jgi:hypothetical protein
MRRWLTRNYRQQALKKNMKERSESIFIRKMGTIDG